ncbi:MAG TPA: SDR family oxidoreductase [Thermoleophilaceae bacterium]|nr:SDR family oxidoreductase [Thermoleophilaceae bacterium]
MSPSGVLLTGATGFVGMQVLARYLEHTDRRVYVLVRAQDKKAAEDRLRDKLSTLFGQSNLPDRLVAVPGDIESPGLGLVDEERERVAKEVGEIVHAAASVSFELPLDASRRINVEGTRRVLELAELVRNTGGLDNFSYISTAYVAGTHGGEFGEDDFDLGQDFRNPYERSKFEAERLVRDHADHLPLKIFRPSIIVGEASSGWTDSFNVLYTPLRAFARGHLPFMPARQRAPVDVVPVDYVADAVFELSQRPVEHAETYHLVAGPEATTVEEIVGLASKELDRPVPLVVPPPLYRRLLHPLLLWRSDGRRRRALRRMETFFPYFAMRVRYGNERARHLLEPKGIRVSPFRSYFGRLIDFAKRARWGERKLPRAQALEPAPIERAGTVAG